ncbi:sulfite exporter TauE/SafE family protein [Flavobacterium gawalongense]|uniref:Probable membrane transporter protein n=1 Tax=Flavobacterium gawalongense TaxID=2594432 RepID=A0A553BVA1_9FLAO|nr:sulfite exporter TauE/SafE family protein [Flavobacterium gawalongense]TRX02723.1 sulfite exporter TauE/SafE family protein [Flavobacterium gawalongense]TRX08031.1 sulfite exporter TauE/SafE family protein [Flavobacterium gawalongense]TRX10932.1 sulfite exporter TauE/SafE family protein [Flavobacterium gawalongense]TRX12178.1 sulfite exporter TauE/SafE family protein [Flavobacterium gawalongense]TRX25154.1 sulfite exporter TauE/SafE family protein [Flavobacterium gawalongense]
MEYIIICLAALLGSGLTLFSGFGLGTLLVPVFGLFFPIEIAIILTAIVHFLNNLFKLFLLGKSANLNVVLRFGIPAILFAFLGAYILSLLTDMQPLMDYQMGNHIFEIMPIKLTIGILLLFFSLFEVVPSLANIQFDKKYLPLGGILSGFFGGLSGNQGALRAAFLIRANLSKQSFIATGVVIACLVDISRLTIYSKEIINHSDHFDYTLLTLATLSAFIGAYFGNKLLEKVTIKTIQNLVTVMLILFAILLIMGII